MKKLSLIFIMAFSLMAGFAQTPFTATYTFGSGGHVTSFAYNGTQHNGITMGNIEKVGQINSFDSPGNFRATGWPTGGTMGASPDMSKYIGFTIAAKPGYEFTVNSITFGLGKGQRGPRLAQWRGSKDSYGAAFTDYTLVSGVGYYQGELELGPYSSQNAGSWTGNVLRLGADYQSIDSSCEFRVYYYAAHASDRDGGLDGPITITGSYTPSIEVSINQLPHFTVQQSAGPSSPQSFTVSAVGLTPTYSLFIDSPDGYELAHYAAGPYSSGTFSVISDNNGNISNAPVYVRLRQGLYAGNYNGNVEIRYEIPDPDVIKLVAVTGTVTQAPEYYVGFEKSYETLGAYSSTPQPVRLGVNEIDGTLNDGYYWNMTQARIGSTTGYVINGTKSARLRGCANSGMEMTQDKSHGIRFVSFCYRRYGTDDQVAWKVEYSIDQGSTWKKAGNTFTAPANNEVQTFAAYIDDSRPVRIRIVRADSSQNPNNSLRQLNIDCIRIEHYYDLPNNVTRTTEEGDQITVTGGNANLNHGATLSQIPNTGFTPSFHQRLLLLGNGPWTFTVTNTAANYVAYKQGGDWQTFELTSANNHTATFTVYAAKNSEIELLTGSGSDPTLPVTLSHFSAVMTAQNFVQLTWVTQSESNLLGYHVFRGDSDDIGSALLISDLIEATNSSSPQTYVFFDKELTQEGTYYYWLQSMELDSSAGFYGPVSVFFSMGGEGGSPGVPKLTQLKNAYPNPFNPSTTLNYQLKDPAKVRIDIYNTRGQMVRSFERYHDAAGHYDILWDGRDSSGKELSSGVYLYRMSSGTYRAVKKVVLQK